MRDLIDDLIQFDFLGDGLAAHVAGVQIRSAVVTCAVAAQEDNVAVPLHADATVVRFFQLLQACLQLSLGALAFRIRTGTLPLGARDFPGDSHATGEAAFHAPTAL